MTTAIATTATKMTPVYSTPPAKLTNEHILIAMSRRSTKDNPVDAKDRYRSIEVHAGSLAIAPEDCRSKFAVLLQSTIQGLADAKFSEWAKDNLEATEADPTAYTLDNVLAYWAEEKQKNTIDADKVKAWLKDSKTLAAMPEKSRAIWLERVPKITSKVYRNSFPVNDAASIVAKMDAADMETPIGMYIATRCSVVIDCANENNGL